MEVLGWWIGEARVSFSQTRQVDGRYSLGLGHIVADSSLLSRPTFTCIPATLNPKTCQPESRGRNAEKSVSSPSSNEHIHPIAISRLEIHAFKEALQTA